MLEAWAITGGTATRENRGARVVRLSALGFGDNIEVVNLRTGGLWVAGTFRNGGRRLYPSVCQVALKEWAVTVRAFERGEQILLVRKGGIREDGKDFRVLHPEFLLYPTFEHQKAELLKERYHGDLHHVLSQDRDGSSVTFSHWASLEEAIEVTDQEEADALSPYHIWTTDYVHKRLHWKPRQPLSLMLLRLYRLEEPRTLPYEPRYGGCTSWVELSQDIPLGRLAPVLTDVEFAGKVGEIKGALGV